MPIKIPEQLPAYQILKEEGYGFLNEKGSVAIPVKALKVGILNLMPTKIATETQLLRLLNNSPLPLEVTLLRPATHISKNTPLEHLLKFYKTFEQVKNENFDGLIITGAPVEKIPFEQVDYWQELCEIMDWEETHVRSTFYVCWGAQAGLYHKFGIPKYPLQAKMFGVFPHNLQHHKTLLLRGFDDIIYAPHSRHTEIRRADIEKITDILILSESEDAGMYMVIGKDQRHIFITGHSEYDPLTLKAEYDRDIKKALPITIPRNYYPGDDPSQTPIVRWRGHANQLFSNWLHHYVNPACPTKF